MGWIFSGILTLIITGIITLPNIFDWNKKRKTKQWIKNNSK